MRWVGWGEEAIVKTKLLKRRRLQKCYKIITKNCLVDPDVCGFEFLLPTWDFSDNLGREGAGWREGGRGRGRGRGVTVPKLFRLFKMKSVSWILA